MTSLSIQDKEIMEKLADKKLSKQEIFEAKYNLLGFFSLARSSRRCFCASLGDALIYSAMFFSLAIFLHLGCDGNSQASNKACALLLSVQKWRARYVCVSFPAF